jgi:hypothetical protein
MDVAETVGTEAPVSFLVLPIQDTPPGIRLGFFFKFFLAVG